MTLPAPVPVDLSTFTDDQLAMLLNFGGGARVMAMTELARRHPAPDLTSDVVQGNPHVGGPAINPETGKPIAEAG